MYSVQRTLADPQNDIDNAQDAQNVDKVIAGTEGRPGLAQDLQPVRESKSSIGVPVLTGMVNTPMNSFFSISFLRNSG